MINSSSHSISISLLKQSLSVALCLYYEAINFQFLQEVAPTSSTVFVIRSLQFIRKNRIESNRIEIKREIKRERFRRINYKQS